MKKFDTIDVKGKMYFNPVTQVLAPFKLDHCTWTPNKDEVLIVGEADGLRVSFTYKEGEANDQCARFFDSEDDFRANKPTSSHWTITPSVVTYKAFGFSTDKDKAVRITKNGLTEYDLNEVAYRISDDADGTTIVNVMDKDVYATQEDALMHMDYEVVDEQGNRTIRKALANLVALTDEQRAAVKDLECMIRKVKDMGVVLGFETSEYEVYAFNKNGLNDYEHDWKDQTETRERIRDLVTYVDIHIDGLYSDDDIFITRK